ncbi:MAG TPA: NAD(+)/NADH kinase [Solirubrobacter sp.]|nr:NAD(+)/NADH kinase [Solirubrobacter sp.]
MVTVGVIANPASGRDIRRLVAGASVFGNADKAGMVFRALAGLHAAGVERVLMLPAGDGLSTTLHRHLHGANGRIPPLEEVQIALEGSARDTTAAVEAMLEEDVKAILVLGGDGTHRVVAKSCGDVPICAVSTGTNNAFPELREATVAGLATGLVATGQADAVNREAALKVDDDLALVDVAVTKERFVGARALWRPDDVTELFVTFANPAAVGLSAIAGALAPLPRGGPHGLHVTLGPGRTVTVPLAPGLIASVEVAAYAPIARGDRIQLPPGPGTIALDGERELERIDATVELVDGPLTIDIDAAMAQATLAQPPRA